MSVCTNLVFKAKMCTVVYHFIRVCNTMQNLLHEWSQSTELQLSSTELGNEQFLVDAPLQVW